MKEFKGKVAVVTGAGFGIGRALAKRCALLGMSVVLADIADLSEAEGELSQIAECPGFLSVPTDVSLYTDVEKLAQATIDRFGRIDLLFNNAGVILDKRIWEYTLEDWEWILGVDLYGVIYGIKVFLPIMENQGIDAHIVNTSSLAGFISSPTVGAYKVAKHGVVALTEGLYYELAAKHSPVHVSLLAPSWSNTTIRDSHKRRPERFKNGYDAETLEGRSDERDREVRDLMAGGTQPEVLAEMTFDAIRNDRFYIFSDEAEMKARVGSRMQGVLNFGNPVIIEEKLPVDFQE